MKKELYRQTNRIVNDAFDRLAVEIHLKKQQNGFKTFLLCGCEPGAGTTTISIDLAISMAEAGWKTLMVDCDLRKDAGYKRLNSKTEDGVSEYLSGEIEKKEVVCETNYENLYYVSGGKGCNRQVNRLCSAKMMDFIAWAKDTYDYIIFDAPSLGSAVDADILAAQMDGIILIASKYSSSTKSIAQVQESLERAQANILGIVVNKVDKKEYKKHINHYDYFVKNKFLSAKKGKEK